MEKEAPHVVIVGGGFGGLHVVAGLRRKPVEASRTGRELLQGHWELG